MSRSGDTSSTPDGTRPISAVAMQRSQRGPRLPAPHARQPPPPHVMHRRHWLLLPRFDGSNQLRHDSEQITHDPEVSNFKDRGVRILVDRNDGL